MAKESAISRIVTFVVVFIIGLFLNYLFLPAWNFRSGGIYLFLFFMLIISTLANALVESIVDEYRILTIISAVGIGIIILIAIIGLFSSAQLFHSKSYQTLIEIEEGNFNKDVMAIDDIKEIAVVDVATAEKVGDRTIASLKNPSWYDVDNEYNLIIYNGEQYRISAINYGGFFKYNKAKDSGIPGYVLVDAVTQEAKLVTLDSPIRYSPSAYFSYNLERHLRNQYHSYIFGKSFFEIDEEGNPYWITSVKTSNIGIWGGKTEESFIITDACSGESTEYVTEDLPEWVDHAFDLEYLMEMVYYNYEYINGFINFSKTGVKRTSYYYKENGFTGYNTTISSDGIVFYTGVTPANSAESILGFIFANPRTGIVKFYECNGAEESSAQAAAQGLVQDLWYIATFPTIVNIDENPTYFMTLKDSAGLIQRYALCNVSNYTQVFQANSLEETLIGYRSIIGTAEIPQEDNKIETMFTKGEISSLYTAEIEGYTYFYFTLIGSSDLYMSSIENSNKQVLLVVGTEVNIEYVETSEDNVYVVKSIGF